MSVASRHSISYIQQVSSLNLMNKLPYSNSNQSNSFPSRRDHTSTQCEGPVLLLLKREAKMISPYLILATVVHDRTLPPRRDSDWIGAPVRFYNKKREGKGRIRL